MNLTSASIKRGVTTGMIFLILIGFGLFSLIRLKLDLFPKLEFPMIAVISQYTGVGPFDMETVVTRPIEEAVASVENVKKITSTSAQGLSNVMLEFDWGTDMDQAKIDVRESLDFIRDYLPDDLTEPLVFGFDISMQPILYMALTSNMHDQAELRRICEHELEPRLERVPGVASAFTMGGLQREIQILMNPTKMRAHNISTEQVKSALMMNNLQIPAGLVDNAQQEFTLQADGEYQNVEQIENTAVAQYAGTVIRVRDVARVVDGFMEQRQKVWANDTTAVWAMIQKQSDANTVQVCEEVKRRIPQIEKELPKGIKINIFYDQAEFINRSMSNLGSNAYQAIFLTFLVLLFFLRNLRSSLIVAVSIPVSIIVTFSVMDQAGLTLNIISMAGLALAVGMLVDNAIVVLESIFRFQDEAGLPAREAAERGSKEVGMAITASTLTTIAVFGPVLFVPGLAGELFNDMVVTICFSLIISLVVALTLIPLLASRLLNLKKTLNPHGFLSRLSEKIGQWITDLQTVHYKALHWSLHHRKTVILSTTAAFVISVAILFMMGGDFLPDSDDNFLAVAVNRSPGTSLESMENSMHEINKLLKENIPEAEMIFANFGQGEGVMALFSSQSSSEGDITVRLKSIGQRDRSEFEISDSLRAKVNKFADVEVKFEDRGQAMFSSAGDIVVQIFGYDFAVSKVIAESIKEKVKNIKGISTIETSYKESAPQFRINFDRQRVADLGMSTAMIGQVVSTNVLGSVVTQYREEGDEYNVRVQLDKEFRSSKTDIENILIMTPTGAQIPLRSVAEVVLDKAALEINREGQERVVSVIMNVSGRDLRSVTNDVKKVIAAIQMPMDYRLDISGTAEDQAESFIYLGIAMLVAVVLTYMVMASQFESLLSPFIIMFTIPLSFIGVALALILTGTSMNVMALIGVIMLIGIVVNNGIVLVDYINKLRERGRPLFEAIEEGSRVRLRPVLLTALTTIFGMLPLALGIGESGENWAPMARAVMGGLTVATVLTLVVVPVIYAITMNLTEKLRSKREARAKAREARRLAAQQA